MQLKQPNRHWWCDRPPLLPVSALCNPALGGPDAPVLDSPLSQSTEAGHWVPIVSSPSICWAQLFASYPPWRLHRRAGCCFCVRKAACAHAPASGLPTCQQDCISFRKPLVKNRRTKGMSSGSVCVRACGRCCNKMEGSTSKDNSKQMKYWLGGEFLPFSNLNTTQRFGTVGV